MGAARRYDRGLGLAGGNIHSVTALDVSSYWLQNRCLRPEWMQFGAVFIFGVLCSTTYIWTADRW